MMVGHRRNKSMDTMSYRPASTAEDDDELCPHTKPGCKLSNVKNKLPHAKAHCSVCFPEGKKGHKRSASAASTTSDIQDVHDLMICLKCGEVFCGNGSTENHAQAHFERKRHNIFCNPSSLITWCFACDSEVPSGISNQLDECVQVMKKLYCVRLGILTEDTDAGAGPAVTDSSSESKPKHFVSTFRNGVRSTSWETNLKGLVNIGNTCYVNSVLQCLGRTIPLCESSSDFEKAVMDSVVILPSEAQPTVKKAITVHLNDDIGPLTTSFFKFLKDMNQGDSKATKINPKPLLDELSRKYARFGDYFEQQDSQELLRTMLDGLEEEEEARANQAIFHHFGLLCTKTTDAQFRELPSIKQEEIRGYMHAYQPRVSTVFRGSLRSTVTCQVCSNKTCVNEGFLDISVPIFTATGPSKQPKPTTTSRFFLPLKKKGTLRPNKHDKKKMKSMKKEELQAEKRMKRKDEKAKGKKKKGRRDHDDDYDDSLSIGSSINGHSRNPSGSSSIHELIVEMPNGNIVKPKGLIEGLTVPGGDPTVPDSGPTPLFSVDADQTSVAADSVDGADFNSVVAESTGDVDSVNQKLGGIISSETMKIPDIPKLERKSTYVPKEGECSVEASLSELFREEVLDGDDAFACESCFKNKRPASAPPTLGSDGGDNSEGSRGSRESSEDSESGYVMQKAKKRLTIKKHPQILTIHLKRFEQHGMRLTKVTKHVTFPIILDIDPFSDEQASRVVYDDGEVGIRYELYGVVEHSGKLDSGHYTAFVKDTITPEDGSPSNWWHISDDIVRECSQADVMRSQAYLLFYERLY